jgi:ketosteroid isomerase-like protein
MRKAGLWVLVTLSLAAPAAQSPLPPALEEMIGTERAFAARAKEVGVRDSFLEYFADDAVLLSAEKPEAYRPRLERMPSAGPAAVALDWEPRYGDVAASGELGYLTGPATRTVHDAAGDHVSYLCYFSVWKRQPDGRFRVFIDQGISLPAPASFPAGFTRPPRPTSQPHDSSAMDGVQMAEHDLARAAVRQPLARAYASAMDPSGVIYRDGIQPMWRAEALRWLEQAGFRSFELASPTVHAARSGDLAVSYGAYRSVRNGNETESGHFVHVWTRSAEGRWRLAVDVLAPVPTQRR